MAHLKTFGNTAATVAVIPVPHIVPYHFHVKQSMCSGIARVGFIFASYQPNSPDSEYVVVRFPGSFCSLSSFTEKMEAAREKFQSAPNCTVQVLHWFIYNANVTNFKLLLE